MRCSRLFPKLLLTPISGFAGALFALSRGQTGGATAESIIFVEPAVEGRAVQE